MVLPPSISIVWFSGHPVILVPELWLFSSMIATLFESRGFRHHMGRRGSNIRMTFEPHRSWILGLWIHAKVGDRPEVHLQGNMLRKKPFVHKHLFTISVPLYRQGILPPSQPCELMDSLWNFYSKNLKQDCEHFAKIVNFLSNLRTNRIVNKWAFLNIWVCYSPGLF